ncbi:hypothetical protein LC040_12405 [Bacillus tianshenii]|nr:hypothetical protein LC040_12405 [Bacillus tianshenii]
MMVEINLIPDRERRNLAPLLLIVLIIALVSLASFWLYSDYQKQAAQLDKQEDQLRVTEQLVKIEKEKQAKVESSQTFQQLENAVVWTEKKSYSTVSLIKHLAELLPQRGFFLSVNITNDEKVSLNVQFDTSREAAFYLQRLKDSEAITEAKLLSLSTAPIAEENSNVETVPRYTAQYDLTFDATAFPRLQEETE